MKVIMKVVKSIEESCLFIKGVSERMENSAKEQKEGSLSALLGTLATSLSEVYLMTVELPELVRDLLKLVRVMVFNASSFLD